MCARPGRRWQPGGCAPAPIRPAGCTRAARPAFTLVELLVVIGIIALLIAILLPSLLGARKQAMAVKCAANVRSICTAMLCYASENRGAFPPEMVLTHWYDRAHVGAYLPRNRRGHAALACPADSDADRSYSMNIWACSAIEADIAKELEGQGRRWGSYVRDSSRMILVTESWSGGRLSLSEGYTAEATVGRLGPTPGRRFGAGGGLSPLFYARRWGTVLSELPYWRHRKQSGPSIKDPVGRVNIGYADGHVAMKAEWELADFQTGRSTLDSLWTPEDPQHNE